MSDKRKIILNNVFPDATYNTGNNLYHETINLFKSDNSGDEVPRLCFLISDKGVLKVFAWY